MEAIDRENLFVWNTAETSGYNKKLRKAICLKDIKKHRFSYINCRCI